MSSRGVGFHRTAHVAQDDNAAGTLSRCLPRPPDRLATGPQGAANGARQVKMVRSPVHRLVPPRTAKGAA